MPTRRARAGSAPAREGGWNSSPRSSARCVPKVGGGSSPGDRGLQRARGYPRGPAPREARAFCGRWRCGTCCCCGACFFGRRDALRSAATPARTRGRPHLLFAAFALEVFGLGGLLRGRRARSAVRRSARASRRGGLGAPARLSAPSSRAARGHTCPLTGCASRRGPLAMACLHLRHLRPLRARAGIARPSRVGVAHREVARVRAGASARLAATACAGESSARARRARGRPGRGAVERAHTRAPIGRHARGFLGSQTVFA